MKFPGTRPTRIALAFVLSTAAASAQVIPAHPSGFKTRELGPESGDPGVTVAPRGPEPKVRHVTYVVLSPPRTWTSADGREITGKLIAFEDIVIEAEAGQTPPEPDLPKHPTVVREGNVRLLVNRKASILPLERLSEADRVYIEEIRRQREKPAEE